MSNPIDLHGKVGVIVGHCMNSAIEMDQTFSFRVNLNINFMCQMGVCG